EGEGFGGFKIDYQLVLVRGLHEQIGRFLTFRGIGPAASSEPLGVDSWGDDAKVYLGQLTFREDASVDRLSPTLLSKTSSGSCPASRKRSRKFCVAAMFRERTASSLLKLK